MFDKYINNELEYYYNTINNSKLKEIIKYSLSDGKCIRGFIVKHLINTLNSNNVDIWEPIVAVELIHGISLVLDDLPCMDNDTIRRNKPSTFVAFGERHAILVSMFGISEAFKLLFMGIKKIKLNNIINNDKYIEYIENILNEWNELIGQNLIIGQMLDFKDNVEELLNFKIPVNPSINLIYYKTSSLFIFSFILGCIFSGTSSNLEDYKNMGKYFGLMFQIMDDSNDIDKDTIDNNIFLSLGKEESINLYRDAENKFVELLIKNNILTKEMEYMISKLNSKLVV
jgi:geranylgeranyl diphosphate synthase type II